jgi:hypothetical protein
MASAYGAGAQAGFMNSAAFGAGAMTSRINQQVFGTVKNTYTFPGVTSAASASFLSGPAMMVVTDASGNLSAVPIKDPKGHVINTPLLLGSGLSLGVADNRKPYTGVAMAFAMVGTPMVLPNEKLAFSLNWGTFEGANGSAVSAAFRIYKNVQLNGSFAYGLAENMPGGRVGLRFGF